MNELVIFSAVLSCIILVGGKGGAAAEVSVHNEKREAKRKKLWNPIVGISKRTAREEEIEIEEEEEEEEEEAQ